MRSKTRSILVVFLGIIFCGLSAAMILLAITIPGQTAARFGPPAPGLYWWEHLFYSVQLMMYEDDLTAPNPEVVEPAVVRIELGEPVVSIARKLSDLRLIDNPEAFILYLSYSGLDRTIQAGEYSIEPGWNALDIAREIQDATPAEIVFTVLPGWRLEEIAMSLPTSGLGIDPDAFIDAAQHPDSIGLLLPPGWPAGLPLEGIFLPGEYRFLRETTLEEFVTFFIHHFEENVRMELEAAFLRQGLSLHEALILASVVEKEAVITEEEPMIASVFYNRLNDAMRLESDPTVQFAIGYYAPQQTWWKNPLSTEDLSIESAYNTYRYAGLPPGPICNPALSALRAVAFPAQTTYFYFRSACDGSGKHAFANTYEEHLENGCENKE